MVIIAVYGILRIKQITQGGISHVGGEEDRRHANQRNNDIDPFRQHLNMQLWHRDSDTTLYRAWQDKCRELKVKPSKKGQAVMEQAIITASPEFFHKLGWDSSQALFWSEKDIPLEILDYFTKSLEFMVKYIGEDNIISATIHLDESTPHMHIDYVPVAAAGKRRKDVYQRDEHNKTIRNDKGHAIRARDENGKIIYEYVEAPARLNRTDFWQQRGGRQSYHKMQNTFYEQVSSLYGLERGEISTGREHIEQERFKAKEAHIKASQAKQEADIALKLNKQEQEVVERVKYQTELEKQALEKVKSEYQVIQSELNAIQQNPDLLSEGVREVYRPGGMFKAKEHHYIVPAHTMKRQMIAPELLIKKEMALQQARREIDQIRKSSECRGNKQAAELEMIKRLMQEYENDAQTLQALDRGLEVAERIDADYSDRVRYIIDTILQQGYQEIEKDKDEKQDVNYDYPER